MKSLPYLMKAVKKHAVGHRLTKPSTPKTNGMEERVNGIIKENTVAKIDFETADEMKNELMKFAVHHNLYRRHGNFRRELNVKTPFQASKPFHKRKEIFNKNSSNSENYLLLSQCHCKQPRER